MYGSVTSKDIADALARRGITVDRHKIDLDEPLKSLGTYKVAVKVFSGMAPEVTIVVEGVHAEVDDSAAIAATERLVAAGARVKEAAAVVAELTGARANALYQAVLDGR